MFSTETAHLWKSPLQPSQPAQQSSFAGNDELLVLEDFIDVGYDHLLAVFQWNDWLFGLLDDSIEKIAMITTVCKQSDQSIH